MSKDTARASTVHKPFGKPGGPGLFGVKGMQLPAYVQNIAHRLVEQGHPRSQAIQMAIGIVKNWAEGKGNVGPEVRAAAAKAVAEWEAAKTRAHADGGKKGKSVKLSNELVEEGIKRGIFTFTENVVDLAGAGRTYRYKHGWILINPGSAGSKRNATGNATRLGGPPSSGRLGKLVGGSGKRKFRKSTDKNGNERALMNDGKTHRANPPASAGAFGDKVKPTNPAESEARQMRQASASRKQRFGVRGTTGQRQAAESMGESRNKRVSSKGSEVRQANPDRKVATVGQDRGKSSKRMDAVRQAIKKDQNGKPVLDKSPVGKGHGKPTPVGSTSQTKKGSKIAHSPATAGTMSTVHRGPGGKAKTPEKGGGTEAEKAAASTKSKIRAATPKKKSPGKAEAPRAEAFRAGETVSFTRNGKHLRNAQVVKIEGSTVTLKDPRLGNATWTASVNDIRRK